MISYGRQYIDQKDIKAVSSVLKSNWLTQGPQVEKFEKGIQNFLGAKYACAVNNGTAALHLACLALKIKENDLVLTTPITFLSSVNSILYVKAKPIFIDIDKDTYCIDIDKMEKKIINLKNKNKRIKAAIITDYAGQPCDWKKISALAKKYNFLTINDNCHSFGSKYYDKKNYAAKYADIATYSFHPVKTITTGEGGCVVTNNKKINETLRVLRNHGVVRNKKIDKKKGVWFYEMIELGFNYRLSDIQSALGTSQLKKINFFLKKRKEIANFYNKFFINRKIFQVPKVSNFCEHSYHLYPLQINFKSLKIDKKTFFKKMLEKGIKLQVHYIPIYKQKYYKKIFNFKDKNFPVSENFYKNIVSIPIFPSLTKNNLKLITKNKLNICK